MFKDEFGLYPIAIIEHHGLKPADCERLGARDICDHLNQLWACIRQERQQPGTIIDAGFIQNLNSRIATSLSIDTGQTFKDVASWESLIETGPSDFSTDQDAHWRSWLFSELYWKHLETAKLSTCWFYYNIFNISCHLPEVWLKKEKIGGFLSALSDAGPPLYDGQTFNPGDYI